MQPLSGVALALSHPPSSEYLSKPLDAFMQLFHDLLDRVLSNPKEDADAFKTKCVEHIHSDML